MKKEVILAIILGLSLGLLITYGIYTAQRSLSTNFTEATDSPQPSLSPDASPLGSLVVTNPLDERIQSTDSTTVVGTTQPNSHVIIFVNDDYLITSADETGNFSSAVTLKAGANVIEVRALDQDGNETTTERTVIFSTADLTNQTSTAAATRSATKADEKE